MNAGSDRTKLASGDRTKLARGESFRIFAKKRVLPQRLEKKLTERRITLNVIYYLCRTYYLLGVFENPSRVKISKVCNHINMLGYSKLDSRRVLPYHIDMPLLFICKNSTR